VGNKKLIAWELEKNRIRKRAEKEKGSSIDTRQFLGAVRGERGGVYVCLKKRNLMSDTGERYSSY